MNRMLRRFSIFTLRGKIFILVGLFIFFLVIFSSVIIFRLNRTADINKKVAEQHIPIIRSNKEILNAIDKNMALQRAYIITENKDLVEERVTKWETTIDKALSDLENSKEVLKTANVEHKLDSLEMYLYQYGSVQKKLDDMITKKIEKTAGLVNVSDTLLALEKMHADEQFSAEIGPFIVNEVIGLENNIIDLITTIIKEQETLMVGDMKKNSENLSFTTLLTLLIAVIAAIAGGIIAQSFSVSLVRAVNKPRKLLDQLALGVIPDSIEESSDELNPIILAGNQVKEMLKEASKFSLEVGNGNFKYKFTPASENDFLGNALLNMRDQLDKLAEEERRRAWMSEGIANFAAILRSTERELSETCDKVLSELIKYIGANQGGIFIHNNEQEDDQYLEMISCYAYDKKKFIEKRLRVARKFGEGLIGQTFIEKETTILKDVPNSYINISSGLGEKKPSFLLLVPLMLNESVEGVIEIASFNTLEDYKIEFVEKIAESLASSISSLKNNQITKMLLEEAQDRQEQFNAQEEEMRQNLEELSTTQEEMVRKQDELLRLKTNLEEEVKQKTYTITKEKEAFIEMASVVPGMIFQLEYFHDDTGRFKVVSEGAKKLTGFDKNHFKTLTDFEALLEDDSKTSFKEILKSGAETNNDIEWEGCLSVGEEFKWVKLLAGSSKKESDITTFSGTISDISISIQEREKYKMQAIILNEHENENKRVIEEIEQHKRQVEILNARYELASLSSNECLFEININLNNTQISETTDLWLSSNVPFVFGLEIKEAPSTIGGLLDNMIEEDGKLLLNTLNDYINNLEKRDHFSFEFRMKSKNELVNWFKIDGLCEKEEDKTAFKIGGVIKNIQKIRESSSSKTEERQLEEITISKYDELINFSEFELVFIESNGEAKIRKIDNYIFERAGYKANDLENISLEKFQECFINESNKPYFAEFLAECFERDEKLNWQGKIKSEIEEISVMVSAIRLSDKNNIKGIKGVIVTL